MARDARGGGGMSDEDTLLLLSPLILVVVLAALPSLWAGGAEWLVAHHVLVAATDRPMLAVPGAGGAGFDWRRLAAAGALLLLALAAAVSGLRRQHERRLQRRLGFDS